MIEAIIKGNFSVIDYESSGRAGDLEYKDITSGTKIIVFGRVKEINKQKDDGYIVYFPKLKESFVINEIFVTFAPNMEVFK